MQKDLNIFIERPEEKKKKDEDQMNPQSKIAKASLNWDKTKHHEARLDAKKANVEKAQLESDLTEKKINWE